MDDTQNGLNHDVTMIDEKLLEPLDKPKVALPNTSIPVKSEHRKTLSILKRRVDTMLELIQGYRRLHDDTLKKAIEKKVKLYNQITEFYPELKDVKDPISFDEDTWTITIGGSSESNPS